MCECKKYDKYEVWCGDIEQYTVIHAMKYIQGATAQISHADFAIWPRTLTEAAR